MNLFRRAHRMLLASTLVAAPSISSAQIASDDKAPKWSITGTATDEHRTGCFIPQTNDNNAISTVVVFVAPKYWYRYQFMPGDIRIFFKDSANIVLGKDGPKPLWGTPATAVTRHLSDVREIEFAAPILREYCKGELKTLKLKS
jgi:hypothetical protein